jgi:hypothetical protein
MLGLDISKIRTMTWTHPLTVLACKKKVDLSVGVSLYVPLPSSKKKVVYESSPFKGYSTPPLRDLMPDMINGNFSGD